MRINSKNFFDRKLDNVPPHFTKFSKWFSYINGNKTLQEYNEVEKKFDLIDKFLNNKKRIDTDKNFSNTDDLSEKSLVSQDELMTETLAKVLMKQKK